MKKISKNIDSWAKYFTAAILVSVPLYPKFPFLKVPGTFVSVRLEDLLLGVGFIYLCIYFWRKQDQLFKNKIFKVFFYFLFVGFLSFLSGLLISKTVEPLIGLLHWGRRIEYFVPFFLGYVAIKDNKDNLRFFINLIIVVCLLVFVYGLGQRFWSWPIIVTQNQEYAKGIALRWIEGAHINSSFAGHYDLATFLIIVTPIIITLTLLISSKISKLILTTTFAANLWLLVNSASRISLVSFLLSASLALVIIKKKKFIPIIFLISLLFMNFSTNLLGRYSRIFEVTKDNIQKIIFIPDTVLAAEELNIRRPIETPTPTPLPVFEDRSTSIRLNVEWPRALRAFLKNPLLGTGMSSIGLATDNDYLRMLGEVGIIGFLAFSMIFLDIFSVYLGRFPLAATFKGTELAFVSSFLASLGGVFLNAMFIDVFEASKFAIVFWLLAGISLSILENKND